MIPHLLEEAVGELERFAREPRSLLVLDFDGTLSPFAPAPDAARIDPAAATALEALRARAGEAMQVGVASGRRVEDLRRLLPRLDFLIGLHGLELAIGEQPSELRGDIGESDRALAELRTRLAPVVRHGGRIEDKTHSLAVHVRGLDAAAAALSIAAFARAVEDVSRASGPHLECLRGHEVIEARPSGSGKQHAVEDVARRLSRTALAYVGDDATDEDVFRALPSALTVAVMDPPRPTAARFFIRSPAETASMLARLAALRRD